MVRVAATQAPAERGLRWRHLAESEGGVFVVLDAIATQLAERRRALGLRQSDVAELMGVTRVTVTHVESGWGTSVEAVARYADAVGLRLVLDVREDYEPPAPPERSRQLPPWPRRSPKWRTGPSDDADAG